MGSLLGCGETSITKFKIPLYKDLLQVDEIMVLISVDTSYHIQGIRSSVYALVIMHHGKVSFIIIVNSDGHLVRELEDIRVPGHGEGALFKIKSLEIHGIILRSQDSALEVSHEDNSYCQY